MQKPFQTHHTAYLGQPTLLKVPFIPTLFNPLEQETTTMRLNTTFNTAIFAVALLTSSAASAQSELREEVFLLPAPMSLPAFAPFHVAVERGYYADEGLNPIFHIAKGGADVAIQVAVGNASIGLAAGDTPIIVRPNGLPVKAVALLGGQALTHVSIRSDEGIENLSDLAGKRIGVMSFQDTSYYNLLGVLAAVGVDRDDVDIQSLGPAGMTQLMVSGDVDAISAVPEWSYQIETAGVPVDIHMINDLFPSMTQAIVSSDSAIEDDPELIQAFVKATLRGYSDVIADPKGTALEISQKVAAFHGQEESLGAILSRYAEFVYASPDELALGEFAPERYTAVRDFYVTQGIAKSASPLDDYYTNQFVD
ncbi:MULTISPECIES: ABC transporter substrate-binding protein [Pacificibacter]|uniref:ABC transporter substrate-binding protein n=1 Tax=Pacificibacter TaxID=1042323 RepID=UPI001C0A5964|nr:MULTISPECIES: ABC transporter substrate-binding protein [Pacificibacter]MBU2935211.1 ABC transporter substrate-binding protein [Pacificibacter marinus]MDO6616003.1 ABC transporter substrate-binding protein [Pacificibacter sp. 1_MG-2023]